MSNKALATHTSEAGHLYRKVKRLRRYFDLTYTGIEFYCKYTDTWYSSCMTEIELKEL